MILRVFKYILNGNNNASSTNVESFSALAASIDGGITSDIVQRNGGFLHFVKQN